MRWMTRRRLIPLVGVLTGLLLWGGAAQASLPTESVDGPDDVPSLVGIAPMSIISDGRHISGVLPKGTTWAGALESTGGLENVPAWALYWCIQSGLIAPDDPVTATGTITDPQLGYLLTRYQDDPRFPLELVRGALGAEVHIRQDIGTKTLPSQQNRSRWASVLSTSHTDIQSVLDAYRADAAANAGPYSADLTFDVSSDGRAGTVRAAILGGAGTPVSGFGYTLHIDGDATFTATGTKDLQITADGTTQNFDLVASATGDVTVSISAQDLPSTALAVGKPGSDKEQTVLAVTNPTSLSKKTTKAMRYDFAIVGISKVTTHVADPGQSIGDTLDVAATPDAAWILIDGVPIPVTLTATAYPVGTVPVDEQPAVPSDATTLGEFDVIANGPGKVSAPELKEVDPGAVTWVWTMRLDKQPDAYRRYFAKEWSDAYGLADETTIVRATVDIASSLTVMDTKDGKYILDYQWVKGAPSDHGKYAGGAHWAADVANYTNTLHFIPGDQLPGPDSCTVDTIVGDPVEVELTNGVKPAVGSTSWLVDPTATGTWVVIHQHPGDDRTMPFTSACDDTDQWFRQLPEPVRVITQASSDNELVIGQPAVVKDTATVTEGTVPDGAETRFDLYTWPTGSQPVCTPDTLIDSKTVPMIQGTFDSPTFEVTEVTGELGFVENSLLNGAVISTGVCGETTETLTPETPPAPAAPTPNTETPHIASPPTPHLAKTGSDGTQIMLWTAVNAALIGTVLILLRRKKQAA
jgi:LPXTG-motif cell wall-anchored protein